MSSEFCLESAAQQPQTITLIPAPTRELALQPPARSGQLYGRAVGLARWHVAQWNSPGSALPDFVNGQTSNGNLTFQVANTDPVTFTIVHDGRALRCVDADGRPLESDAFIGANKSAATPVSLSVLRAVQHTIEVSNENVTLDRQEGTPCATSKVVGMSAIVLTNKVNGSTLFYQILLFGAPTPPHSFWYRRGHGNIFGFNDTPLAFRQPLAAVGHTARYRFDLLPRLKQLIADSSLAIDHDLEHWQIGGAYFGTSIWGHVRIQTRWSAFSLTGNQQ